MEILVKFEVRIESERDCARRIANLAGIVHCEQQISPAAAYMRGSTKDRRPASFERVHGDTWPAELGRDIPKRLRRRCYQRGLVSRCPRARAGGSRRVGQQTRASPESKDTGASRPGPPDTPWPPTRIRARCQWQALVTAQGPSSIAVRRDRAMCRRAGLVGFRSAMTLRGSVHGSRDGWAGAWGRGAHDPRSRPKSAPRGP